MDFDKPHLLTLQKYCSHYCEQVDTPLVYSSTEKLVFDLDAQSQVWPITSDN